MTSPDMPPPQTTDTPKSRWAIRLAIALPLGLFLSMLILLLTGLELNPGAIPSTLINKPAPEFSLPDLDGTPNGLTTDHLKGQISVLNVWASWCVPCRAEHPLLMELKDKTGVTLYGLNQKDIPAQAKAFLAELGNPYDRIGADANRRVSIDFGVYGVPETFVIGSDGTIKHKHIGQLTQKDMDTVIMPLLADLGVGPS